jgi:HlyD family secretion protein
VHRVEPSAFTKVSPLGVEKQGVNVLLERVDSALILPSSALFREGEGWAVFRIVSGRARTKAVQVPRRGPLDSRLTSGLQEGDRVVLYPSDAVREGVRIKAP